MRRASELLEGEVLHFGAVWERRALARASLSARKGCGAVWTCAGVLQSCQGSKPATDRSLPGIEAGGTARKCVR